MKRAVKHTSSIYAFLEKKGVLETGDPALIASAKREYYKLYQCAWKKAKRHESISYTVLFTLKEASIVQQSASRNHTSPTNYIKQSALYGTAVPDKRAIGEIRELLFKYHDFIEHNSGTSGIPEHLRIALLQEIERIEKTILGYIKFPAQ